MVREISLPNRAQLVYSYLSGCIIFARIIPKRFDIILSSFAENLLKMFYQEFVRVSTTENLT